MSSEKTDAIVIRVTEYSETSCIVTMLTRDFGKVTVIAKGARRPKSPFEAAIDVLAICRIVFIAKTNSLSLLTEAKLEHRFRAGESDLNRLYIGYYVIELLKILTDEGEPQPELYQLAFEMIRILDTVETPISELKRQLLQFELGLLDILGHLPMLTRCVDCGREKTQLTKVNFGLNAGGVLCHDCRRGQSNIITISESGFEFLLSLVGGQIGKHQENSDNWNQPDRVNENRLRSRSWSGAPKNQPQTGQKSSDETAMTDFKGNKTESNEPINQEKRNNDDSIAYKVTGNDQKSTAPFENEPKDSSNIYQTDNTNTTNPSDELTAPSKPTTEIRRLINQYIAHLIGYPPRLHKFLQNL